MVVVTGATGHIGNALIREFASKGERVCVLALPTDDISSLKGFDVDIKFGDVRDINSLITAFKGAQYVYHLAGIVSIGSGKRKLIHDVNVLGTRNVVDACIQSKVKRLVYVSSIHAFTEPPRGIPIVETKDFDPSKVIGQYGKSKAEATNEVLKGIERGLDAVIVHPTGVIGPYEYRMSNTGQLMVDFMNRKLFAYIDGGYDFVDVRDAASGIILAADKGRRGENYILSGEWLTVKSLLKLLEDNTSIKAPAAKIPLWLARLTGPLSELYYYVKRQKPLYTSYSISTLSSNSLTTHEKATRELGYTARPIKESIADTVKWLQQNMRYNIN